jgi:hypothetical protein
MSDDDFIERVSKNHERWTGREWTPEQTRKNFAAYGKAKRIEALEMIDVAVKDADTSNLREFVRLTRLRTDLERDHQDYIRNGR